jgi:hypothetical protein
VVTWLWWLLGFGAVDLLHDEADNQAEDGEHEAKANEPGKCAQNANDEPECDEPTNNRSSDCRPVWWFEI